jgi:iron complex transport system permease protein
MKDLLTPKKLAFRVAVAAGILLLLMFLCSLVGSKTISFQNVLQGSQQKSGELNVDYEIYMHVRVPQIFLAAIVGAALACAGAVLQAILRNPLADPYLLGISSGAGLGTMLAVVAVGVSWSFWGISSITLSAFVCALITVWMVWLLGGGGRRGGMSGLLLAGVVVNAFLSAVIMFLNSIARAGQIQTTIFWLMGNITALENYNLLWICGGIVIAGVLILLRFSPALNLLSFSPEEARSAGVNVKWLYQGCFAISALITAVAVSLSGLVGFVGLIVPHGVRLLIGPDHRQLIPISALAGAGFVVLADTVSRVVVAPAVMPVGVVTALAGGPFFLFLLVRHGKKLYAGG